MRRTSLWWLRYASTLIDMATVYSLSILLQAMIWTFTFLSFGKIFAVVFLIYYLSCYRMFGGRTIARFLTGIKVTQKDGAGLTSKSIFLREVLLKWGCGVLIPFFLLEEFLPLWSYLYLGIVFLVFSGVSIIVLLLVKKTWWELFSNTVSTKEIVNRTKSRPFLYAVTLLTASAITVTLYPFIFGEVEWKNSFSPQYPSTAEIERYSSFIKSNSNDPVDYIFELFDQKDIVVISERLHPEYTQYELIFKIVSDQRFTKEVGNIFTELGSESFQDTLNSYLHTNFLSEDALNKTTADLQLNSSSVWPLWSNTNLFDFFKTVSKLNVKLADSTKINWYFTGPPVDWRTVTHEKFVQSYTDPLYDNKMASHIIDQYKNHIVGQKRHKALVIMNSRHGYGLLSGQSQKRFADQYQGTTSFLMQHLPGQVANVMLNTVSLRYGYMKSPIQQGKWDKAFAQAGNRDVAFDFAGSPFGADVFDMASTRSPLVSYSDMFTGFIFYKPVESHIIKDGFPHIVDEFDNTVLKRSEIVGKSYTENVRQLLRNYKQRPDQPIFTEHAKYAILYNIANAVVVPLLLLVALVTAMLFFIRQPARSN